MSKIIPSYYPPNPRYVMLDGVWYLRQDHVADQLEIAIELAFADGMRFAQSIAQEPVTQPALEVVA